MPLLTARRRVCTLVVASALLLGVVLAPGAASAPHPWKQTVEIRLSSNRAAKPFGAVFAFQMVDTRCGRVACPRGPDAERPKNAAKIEVQLPRGTRYNPKGALGCSFWDAAEMGRPCVGGSLLGTGSVSYNFNPFGSPLIELQTGRLWVDHAYGGVRDPERPQEELLGRGLGFFMELAGELGGGRYAFPGRMTRRGLLTITMPERVEVFGEPGSLTGLLFRIRKNAQLNGTPLLRTPRRCNPEKGWRTKTVFTYKGGSTKTLFTRHPCFGRRGAS